MTASPGASSTSRDDGWPEAAQWSPPDPHGALLPPLSQPRLVFQVDAAAVCSVSPFAHETAQSRSLAASKPVEAESFHPTSHVPSSCRVLPADDLAATFLSPSTSPLISPLLNGELALVNDSETRFTVVGSTLVKEPDTLSTVVETDVEPVVAEPVELAALGSETAETVSIQIADAPPTKPSAPRRKRSRLTFALIDAVGILLIILAIALVGMGISHRRSSGSTLRSTVTPVATSIDPNTPPSTVPGRFISGVASCPSPDGSERRATSFQKSPPLCIDPAKRYRATIVTNKGSLNLTLDAAKAPMTVNNFVVLARYHFFDNTVCPRIIPGYLFQCGDPTGKGTGGPGYRFPDELPAAGEYRPGSVAMATSAPDTNGSQFFIVLGADGVALPPKYSLFGNIDPGQEALLALLDAAGTERGTPTKELVSIQAVVIFEE
jgi:cyclophilin family peptidyl-prolyl cis-trans isomerase